MTSPKDLYCNMIEIKRKYSEAGSVDMSSRVDGGNSVNNTNFLDWAAQASRYLDDLPFAETESMYAIFWREIKIPSDKAWALKYADEGLKKWYRLLPDELIEQGELIDAKLA